MTFEGVESERKKSICRILENMLEDSHDNGTFLGLDTASWLYKQFMLNG